MTGTDGANIWAIFPDLLWFIFALVAIFLFRNELRGLFSNIIWRVKIGAPIKVASFELGASYVSPSEDLTQRGGAIQIRVDEDEARYNERKKYYDPNHRLFLVHRIAPSKKPKQLYDILIYLVPHKNASLVNVQKVEYYFGHHWNSRIFTSIDRANGFSISTSAFGPFVCTAKVHFTDSESAMIWRYIDFEMGAIGK